MCTACSLGADNYEINSDFMRQGSLREYGQKNLQILLLHSAHSAITAVFCAPAECEPPSDTTKLSATALQHTLAYKKADGVCGSPHRLSVTAYAPDTCTRCLTTPAERMLPHAYAAGGGGMHALHTQAIAVTCYAPDT